MMDFPIDSSTDLIAVLGAGTNNDGSPSVIQIRRCQKAIELWQQNSSALILVMGAAVGNEFVEAETMADWLQQQDVPKARILIEDKTRNTRSQGLYLFKLAEKYKPRSLTVVSDRAHLIRTKMLLKKAGMMPGYALFAGAPVVHSLPEQIYTFIYETVSYAKDYIRTSLGYW